MIFIIQELLGIWMNLKISEIIVANRVTDEIKDVEEKVYTRDLYNRD